MERFLLVMGAGFGFLLTIAFANLLVPILHDVHKKVDTTVPKRKQKGISWRASKKGIPTMGGLCILFACLLSVVALDVGLTIGESEIIITSWTQQVSFALLIAFLFASIGMLDDLTRVARNQPAGLPEFLKFVLQGIAVMLMLVLYGGAGLLSTTTILPVVGAVDMGDAFYCITFVFSLFFVRSVEKTDGLDGLCTSCAFITVLGLLVFSVYLDSFQSAIFPTVLAASVLAFLFWNFYPAKISLGSTGSLFLAGAMLGIAQGINWPGLLWVLGLPYFVEGLFSLLQFCYYLFTGKYAFSNAPFHVYLSKKGWSPSGLIYLFSGISVMGVVFALLMVRLV